MSEQGIHQFRTNLGIVNGGGKEIHDVVLPQLQRDLRMSEPELRSFVALNYPHVSAFLDRAPELVKYLNPATEAVLAQKDNFHDADQFPVANVPTATGPWVLLLLGFALVAIGVVIRVRAARSPLVAAFVIGVGLLFGPLVL